jgi:hypothetical protein
MSRKLEPFRSPENIEDAILLVVSAGLSDFIQNTLATIERAGVTDCMICIALPANALAEVQAVASRWTMVRYILLEDICHARYSWIEDYHDIGTDAFGRFTASKLPAIRFLLESGFKRVTYSDVDVAWMRNPIPLLRASLQSYDVAIQTEGTDGFPPHYCAGFMCFRNSNYAIELLRKLEEAHLEVAKVDPKTHDQHVFNAVVARSEDAIHRVFGLSEQLFANGPLAGEIARRDYPLTGGLIRRIDPMIFHANWSIGLEHKRLLLALTGNWLVGQRGRGIEPADLELGTGNHLAAELDAARRELDAARQQLDAVYASSSLRITAPFRRALHWLNRRPVGSHAPS